MWLRPRSKLKLIHGSLTADPSHEQERMQATSLELQAPEAILAGARQIDRTLKLVGFGPFES